MINNHLKRSVFISLAVLEHSDITAATFITAGKYRALSDMLLNTCRFALFVIEKVNGWLTNNRTVARDELVFEGCSHHLVFGDAVQLLGDAPDKFYRAAGANECFEIVVA